MKFRLSQGCSSRAHLAQLDSHRLLTESSTRQRGVMLILRLHLDTITIRWIDQRVKCFALDFQV